MKPENFIHIRFENSAALDCKRDMLATEIDLVRMNKRLRVYIDSRAKELEIKEQLHKKLRSLKLDLGRLHNVMPGVRIPKLLKGAGAPKHNEEEYEFEELEEKPKAKAETHPKVSELAKSSEPETDDLDAQLQEIQSQLDALA